MSLNLVRGAGSPKEGACWMSALHYFTRKDTSWTDEAPMACVDPTIRPLCIGLNDLCNDEERERLIGPHLFDVIGTADDSLLQQRAKEAARVATEVFVPLANEAAAAASKPNHKELAADIRERLLQAYLKLILDLVAMGKDEGKVEPTRSKEEVVKALQACEFQGCSK